MFHAFKTTVPKKYHNIYEKYKCIEANDDSVTVAAKEVKALKGKVNAYNAGSNNCVDQALKVCKAYSPRVYESLVRIIVYGERDSVGLVVPNNFWHYVSAPEQKL